MLTFDERVKRRVKRKNNRLRKRYPLFAAELQPGGALADWLVTEQQAATDLAAIIASKDAMLARVATNDQLREIKGLELRSLVAEVVDPATLATLDKQRAKIPKAGAYTAEFWFARLRPYHLHEAQARCEHRDSHPLFAEWHDRCPRCHLPITKPPTVTIPQAEQTMLPFYKRQQACDRDVSRPC
ncbi:hypothetical protein [Herpetosiphon geysericola]|uniref:Uncharacterized protein n=1 Tax=Herpetosiphon geysericola TaxID=70996 RepID=A0A0P6XVF7_9CHLR|nr:hypothetical protein [Herpetosiphon geysericola]KPL87539.1 hypothetical protein SE18_10760 [Herpetosiphon geysericola]